MALYAHFIANVEAKAPKRYCPLEAKTSFAVFRRNKTVVSIKKVRRLSGKRLDIGLLEDSIVQAGRQGTEIQLRLVTLKSNGKTYEALTNVLDPERLSAEDMAKLYLGAGRSNGSSTISRSS